MHACFLWYYGAWYGMVLLYAVWHGTEWYNNDMAWYSIVKSWILMAWDGIAWCGIYGVKTMVRSGPVWYGTVRYGMQWYGMIWYGMVWYGIVWYGMVWYSKEQCGSVWYSMFC